MVHLKQACSKWWVKTNDFKLIISRSPKSHIFPKWARIFRGTIRVKLPPTPKKFTPNNSCWYLFGGGGENGFEGNGVHGVPFWKRCATGRKTFPEKLPPKNFLRPISRRANANKESKDHQAVSSCCCFCWWVFRDFIYKKNEGFTDAGPSGLLLKTWILFQTKKYLALRVYDIYNILVLRWRWNPNFEDWLNKGYIYTFIFVYADFHVYILYILI